MVKTHNADATVADVQLVLDNLGVSSRRKIVTTEITAHDNPDYLLDSLLSLGILK